MGKHTKDAPRITVIDRGDGVHLSALFLKIMQSLSISLGEADALVKSHSEEVIHKGKNSTTKSKSNTASNLLGLFRAGMTGKPLSWCNLTTLLKVARISKISLNIVLTRDDVDHEVNHTVNLISKPPRSSKWD